MIMEVVVYNIESALEAQAGGADRIELCDNPAEGGTTPSQGLIVTVRHLLSIEIFIMIRPRGGDFCYSDYEFESMKHDILHCKQLGVQGVVFGILLPTGDLDMDRCRELIALARPMKVTCHRAFDMSRDPHQTLENCIEVGFDRILTSGHMTKAIEGVVLLATLVKKAGQRITIMPGSGVNPENVTTLAKVTNAREIHFGAATERDSAMQYRNPNLRGMGTQQDAEFRIRTVDSNTVRQMRQLTVEASKS